jgi:hypothetical protein
MIVLNTAVLPIVVLYACITSVFADDSNYTKSPSSLPSATPSALPSMSPTQTPSAAPSQSPTLAPFAAPTTEPSVAAFDCSDLQSVGDGRCDEESNNAECDWWENIEN